MQRALLAFVMTLACSSRSGNAAPGEPLIEVTVPTASTRRALESASNPEPAGDQGPARASVRFLCDEKYAAEPCDEAAWMAEVVRTPSASSLLAHDGPGPEGAVWNGDAPMVVIVPESVRSVTIGSSPLPGKKALGLAWFHASEPVWKGALAPVGKPYRVAPVRVDGQLAGEIWFAEGE